jgi:uncharacterized cofD-like protein
LVIDGIGDALQRTKAMKVYVSNLVTKHGQTEGFSVSDHAAEIERFVGGAFIDYVFYNEQKPTRELEKRYKAEQAFLTPFDTTELQSRHYHAVGGSFLGELASRKSSEQLQRRSLIRHDAGAVTKAILKVYKSERDS